jgi:hypothetical protein
MAQRMEQGWRMEGSSFCVGEAPEQSRQVTTLSMFVLGCPQGGHEAHRSTFWTGQLCLGCSWASGPRDARRE